jgi:hypothetical protein
MTSFDFKPINCRKCGHLVWDGLSSAGIPIKLDTARLNIMDEIATLQRGIYTYQIHRTSTSFEATIRMKSRMGAKDPIVLATHTCRSEGFFFGQEAPDYFNRVKPKPIDSEKVPF